MKWERTKHRAARWLVSDAAGLLARGMSYTPVLVDPERKPTHFMESVLNPPGVGSGVAPHGPAVPVCYAGAEARAACCWRGGGTALHVGAEFHFRHGIRQPPPGLGVLPRLHRYRRHDAVRLRQGAD